MKLLVAGGGIMGLMTARALVRAGHAVSLFERGELPNPLASSSDHHRLIRFAYGEAHGYARMVAEAFPAWERLWRDLGRIHYAPTGVLLTGAASDPWLAASRRSLTALGIAWRDLDRAAIRHRLPMLDAAAIEGGLYSPSAGVLFADAIARDLVAWLRAAGAALHAESAITAIDADAGTLRLADGTLAQGDRLVVTAGVWTSSLVPALADKLTPARQTVIHVEPPARLAAHWQAAPVICDVLADGRESVFYAFPPLRGLPVKLGDHCFSKGGDVDGDRTPTPAELARVRAVAQGRLVAADTYQGVAAKTCFYTLSEDERFMALLTGKALVLAGFSGHGYKFAPLIGERVAGLFAGRLDFSDFRAWLAGADGGPMPAPAGP